MSLQFIEYLGASAVSRIGWMPEAPDRVVDVRGTGFVDVVEVLVNGVPSPQFLEMSPTHLLVTVPSGEVGKGITTLSVLTASADVTEAAVIRMRLSSRSEATGTTRLVQSFLYLLLTTPGTDIFQKDQGAGLRSILSYAKNDPSIRALASHAVSTAESQLVGIQALAPVPAQERLAAARLVDLRYDRATSTTSMRVALETVAGGAVSAGVRI